MSSETVIQDIELAHIFTLDLPEITKALIFAGYADGSKNLLGLFYNFNDLLLQAGYARKYAGGELGNQQTSLTEYQKFSAKEKTLVWYALCLQYFAELSEAEWSKVFAMWGEDRVGLVLSLQSFFTEGTVLLDNAEEEFLLNLGIELDSQLTVMAQPDYVHLQSSNRIQPEDLSPHLLAILLKSDVDLYLRIVSYIENYLNKKQNFSFTRK